jgi:hypothetical protein
MRKDLLHRNHLEEQRSPNSQLLLLGSVRKSAIFACLAKKMAGR